MDQLKTFFHIHGRFVKTIDTYRGLQTIAAEKGQESCHLKVLMFKSKSFQQLSQTDIWSCENYLVNGTHLVYLKIYFFNYHCWEVILHKLRSFE